MYRLITKLAACLVVSLAAVSAQAQQSHSFISTKGNDSNSCSSSAPCRSISRALAETTPGGEIVILDSGTYTPATIAQPVTITATGIRAAITAATGNALTVTPGAGNNVTLRGLALAGEGTGAAGVAISGSVGLVTLYDMDIEGFSDAISFTASGSLAVFDSDTRRSANDGILVAPATGAANAYVHNCDLEGSANAGIEVQDNGSATVADSASNKGGTGYLSNAAAGPASLVLKNCNAINDGTGLKTTANTDSILFFAYCLVTQNGTGVSVGAGSTLSGSSPGTSVIANNTTNISGALSAPTGLN